MQYPNGNQPPQWGYNQYSSGYNPPKFIPQELWQGEKRKLKALGMLFSGAIILFILFSSVYVGIIQGIRTLLDITGSSYLSTFNSILADPYFNYAFEMIYSIFIVGGPFFLILKFMKKKGIAPFIPIDKPQKPMLLPLVVIAGFGICLFGNIITSYFDTIFEALTGIGLEMPEMPQPPMTASGIALSLLSSAVVPALIEEMALRGIVMQSLRKYGDWFAIICSAMIFGLMHCNLLQIPFAFIAGIAIGYAVIVTESLWTGILIHFCNNAFSVIVNLIAKVYGTDSVQYNICSSLFNIFIAIGIICAIIVIRAYKNKQFKSYELINSGSKYPLPPPMYSAKVSTPGLFAAFTGSMPMIVAFVAVLYETITMLILTT